MAVEPGFTAAGNSRLSPDGDADTSTSRWNPSTLTGDIWVDESWRQQGGRNMINWRSRVQANHCSGGQDGTEVAFADESGRGHRPLREGRRRWRRRAAALANPTSGKSQPTGRETGKFLLLQQGGTCGGLGIYRALPLDGAQGQPFLVAGSQFNEVQAVFSPDGRWVRRIPRTRAGRSRSASCPFARRPLRAAIAYRESGLISTEGGSQPRWTGEEDKPVPRRQNQDYPNRRGPPLRARHRHNGSFSTQPSCRSRRASRPTTSPCDELPDSVMRTRDADVPAIPVQAPSSTGRQALVR